MSFRSHYFNFRCPYFHLNTKKKFPSINVLNSKVLRAIQFCHQNSVSCFIWISILKNYAFSSHHIYVKSEIGQTWRNGHDSRLALLQGSISFNDSYERPGAGMGTLLKQVHGSLLFRPPPSLWRIIREGDMQRPWLIILFWNIKIKYIPIGRWSIFNQYLIFMLITSMRIAEPL